MAEHPRIYRAPRARAAVNRAGSGAFEAGEVVSREGQGVLGSPASPPEGYVNLARIEVTQLSRQQLLDLKVQNPVRV